MFSKLLFLLIGLTLPTASLAMEESVWDFRGGRVPGEWSLSDGMPVPQATEEGLAVSAPEGGTLFSDAAPPQEAEIVSVTVSTDRPIAGQILWRNPGDPSDAFLQVPVQFPGPARMRRIDINLAAYPEWPGRPEVIGLSFPPLTDILLHEVRFSRWNLWEKIAEGWTSFWTFDRYGPFSINFLWGPLLTGNPVATRELFTTLPPKGVSANRLFYSLMIVAAAAIAGHRMLAGKGKTSRHVILFLLCFAGLWVLYDVRMGLEFLSYATHDIETHLSKPPGQRSMRTYGNFADSVDLGVPHLGGEERFGYIGPPNTPFGTMMRYFAYPALPVETTELDPTLTTWLIFSRPDVAVNAEGKLTVDGTAITAPGEIIERIDEISFIFRTTTTENTSPHSQP